jgi:diketogulonate reductase-like aldo/keto reductase
VPVIPIIRAPKLSQLQDNLASFDLKLLPEHLKTLDDASRIAGVSTKPLRKRNGPRPPRRPARQNLGISAF